MFVLQILKSCVLFSSIDPYPANKALCPDALAKGAQVLPLVFVALPSKPTLNLSEYRTFPISNTFLDCLKLTVQIEWSNYIFSLIYQSFKNVQVFLKFSF